MQIPRSPNPGTSPHVKRASVPPLLSISQSESYKASPLQNALTPPPAEDTSREPFPSVESSIESSQASGHNFHMHSSGLSSSDTTSPTFYAQPVQIYCAGCHRLSILKDSYACTHCISGFCSDCVYALSSQQHRGRPCPKCQTQRSDYRAFQLDLR